MSASITWSMEDCPYKFVFTSFHWTIPSEPIIPARCSHLCFEPHWRHWFAGLLLSNFKDKYHFNLVFIMHCARRVNPSLPVTILSHSLTNSYKILTILSSLSRNRSGVFGSVWLPAFSTLRHHDSRTKGATFIFYFWTTAGTFTLKSCARFLVAFRSFPSPSSPIAETYALVVSMHFMPWKQTWNCFRMSFPSFQTTKWLFIKKSFKNTYRTVCTSRRQLSFIVARSCLLQTITNSTCFFICKTEKYLLGFIQLLSVNVIPTHSV